MERKQRGGLEYAEKEFYTPNRAGFMRSSAHSMAFAVHTMFNRHLPRAFMLRAHRTVNPVNESCWREGLLDMSSESNYTAEESLRAQGEEHSMKTTS